MCCSCLPPLWAEIKRWEAAKKLSILWRESIRQRLSRCISATKTTVLKAPTAGGRFSPNADWTHTLTGLALAAAQRPLLSRRLRFTGLKSKPESAKDDMKAAGDNLQSAAGKTGDAAQAHAKDAEYNARSAVRSSPVAHTLPLVVRMTYLQHEHCQMHMGAQLHASAHAATAN